MGGEITADYGILARYWNPYDSDKDISLIAGIESVYQLGITRTLMNRSTAKRFVNQLRRSLGGSLPQYYEVLIKAPGRGLQFTGPLEIVEAYRIRRPADD